MNIKKKFVSTLLLTAAFCVSPAINVMAEDTTTMQTETLDSAIDNSSEVEGQETENIQTSSTDENESDGDSKRNGCFIIAICTGSQCRCG